MSEVFWDAFPYFLAWGMTFEQYWYGPPRLAEAYRKAHDLKAEEKNEELWMQGVYVLEAIGSIVSKFNGKKHGFEYPTEPHRITPLSTEEKTAKQRSAEEQEQKQVVDWLNALKTSWDKKHGGNE